MRPISVIIPTYNEEENITALLDNIAWVDEVIVVDSFSTDATAQLAGAGGAKVLRRIYQGPADQKNWAIPQATHEWVLVLDADERLSPSLAKEIKEILAAADIPYDGFWIPRQNYFMGRQVRYSGWQGDAVIRLIRRDVCRYDHKQVHEEIATTGLRIGRLRHPLIHYTFRNLSHYLDKINRYAPWSAQDHLERTPRVTAYHLFIKPLFRFFKHYFWKKGILDGQVGFIISVILAWSVFLRYVYIKEYRDPPDEYRDSPDF